MKNFIEKMKAVHWGYLLFALTLVVLGFCFIAFETALNYLAITIGVLVCIAAILQFVFAMAATNRQLKFYIRISVAVLTLSAGVVTFVAQESAIAVLTTLFGLLLIIDGAFKLQTTIQSKRYHVAGWWILLGIAVTTILGGFFLTKFAPDSQSLLALLLGLVLIVDGAGNFFSLYYVSTYEHNMAAFYLRRAKEKLEAEAATTEDAPAEEVPTEDATAEDAPAEDAPAEDAPAEDAPAEDAPAEDAPAEDAPAEDAISDEEADDKAIPTEETPTSAE